MTFVARLGCFGDGPGIGFLTSPRSNSNASRRQGDVVGDDRQQFLEFKFQERIEFVELRFGDRSSLFRRPDVDLA